MFDINWNDATTSPDTTFEQTTVSPHVNQFMADYMFVRLKMVAAGIDPLLEVGSGGYADLALSIVDDAYNQHTATFNKAEEKLSIQQPEA